MPKSQDIIAAIAETAETMKVEVPKLTHEDGKDFNNAELAAALKTLRESGDAPKDDAPTPKTDEAVKTVKKKAKKLPPYSIAPGKALTTLKGLLSDGDEIKPSYLNGGDASLAKHVESGLVIKA